MDPEIPHQKASVSVEKSKKLLYFAQLSLRVLVIAFSLAGAITTITNHQYVKVYGILMYASYSNSSSFRFKLAADFLVCALSLLSLIHVVSLNRPKSNPKNYFYLLLHDLVSSLLLVSGCSAALAIGYVAMFGQENPGWGKICHNVQEFCDKGMISVVLSLLALVFLLLLTVMSAYKLKSQP